VPPVAGSAGYFPGVRVRLLTGEFVGSVTTVAAVAYSRLRPGPPLRYFLEHPHGEGRLEVAPEDVTLAEADA
jgi:hypothetical protein